MITGAPGDQGHWIVVGVDGSPPSKVALAWGIEQAARTGALVEPVIACHWFPMPKQDIDFEGVAENLLADAIRETAKYPPDIRVTPVIIRGDPAPVLLEVSQGADLSRGPARLGERVLRAARDLPGRCPARGVSPA